MLIIQNLGLLLATFSYRGTEGGYWWHQEWDGASPVRLGCGVGR